MPENNNDEVKITQTESDDIDGFIEERQRRKKKKRRTVVITVAIILAVALISVAVYMFIASRSYKAVVEKYMTAHMECNYDKVHEIRSGFYHAAILMQNPKAEAMINQVYEAMEQHRDAFVESLGEEYEQSYQITSAAKMEKDSFEAMSRTFTIMGHDASEKFKEAMMVDIELTADNGVDERTVYLTIVLTKEEDGWKFLGVEGDYS